MATFRKIIQIEAIATHRILVDYCRVVYALCDDGTLWAKTNLGKWDQVDTYAITDSASIKEVSK
jgi:hypothetical protein